MGGAPEVRRAVRHAIVTIRDGTCGHMMRAVAMPTSFGRRFSRAEMQDFTFARQ